LIRRATAARHAAPAQGSDCAGAPRAGGHGREPRKESTARLDSLAIDAVSDVPEARSASRPAVGRASKGSFRRTRKLVRLLPHASYRSALRAGVAAAIEHEDVPFGAEFRTIIDVGAHKGQFALFAARRFPSATLYCLEPLDEPRRRLERVVRRQNVIVLPFAAAARAGRRSFHLSRESDSSSLLRIMSTYTTAFPGTEEARTIEVDAAPLDDLIRDRIERPCLLKVDTQGSELEVLAGAERVLREVDEVFVECSFVKFYAGQGLVDDVVAELRSRGFRLTGVFSIVRDDHGRCLQADLLFERCR
jgi:FkbM family methyltransferase